MGINLGRICYSILVLFEVENWDALQETYKAQWFPKENGRHNELLDGGLKKI